MHLYRKTCLKKKRQQKYKSKKDSKQLKKADANYIVAKSAKSLAKRQLAKAKRELFLAQAEYSSVCSAYEDRHEIVLTKFYALERIFNRLIAQHANVPQKHIDVDDIKVVYKENNVIDIYFGGIGPPDGPWHGHHVLQEGVLVYSRDSFRLRGGGRNVSADYLQSTA